MRAFIANPNFAVAVDKVVDLEAMSHRFTIVLSIGTTTQYHGSA